IPQSAIIETLYKSKIITKLDRCINSQPEFYYSSYPSSQILFTRFISDQNSVFRYMPSKLTKSSAYFVDMEYSNIIYIRLDNGDRYSYHYETLKYIENYKENVTNYNISKYDIRYKHIDNYVDFLINVSRVIENYNYSLFLSIIEPLSLIMEDFVN